MLKVDSERYKNAFLYLLEKLKTIEGKKKACKLFYFLDFDFFEAYAKSFTGDIYIKKKMGPVPSYLEDIYEELSKAGFIKIKKIKTNISYENDTVIYESVITNKKMLEIEKTFSKEELKMLNRIARVYGNLNGKQLEDLSHSQAPWLGVDMFQEIPYELSYYRETEGLTN